ALHRQILPAENGPQYWLHDTDAGPRRAAVAAASTDGNRVHVVLAEHGGWPGLSLRSPGANADRGFEDSAPATHRADIPQIEEAIFLLDGNTPADLVRGLDELRRRTDDQPPAAV